MFSVYRKTALFTDLLHTLLAKHSWKTIINFNNQKKFHKNPMSTLCSWTHFALLSVVFKSLYNLLSVSLALNFRNMCLPKSKVKVMVILPNQKGHIMSLNLSETSRFVKRWPVFREVWGHYGKNESSICSIALSHMHSEHLCLLFNSGLRGTYIHRCQGLLYLFLLQKSFLSFFIHMVAMPQ
jgi:hypothetical protein